MTSTPTPMMSEDEFQLMIAEHAVRGWQLQGRTETTATMVMPHHVNNVLHAVLTLLTFGLWLLVWIPIALGGKDQQLVLTKWERREVWLTKAQRRQLGR